MFSLSTPGKFQINVPQHAQTAEVAEVLAKEGCGLVRLPFSNFENLAYVATHLVGDFVDAGIKVVMDYHPDGRDNSRLALWKLETIWKMVAQVFQDYTSNEVAFHILNEPNADLCQEFYEREVQKACSAVWKITPDRLCIVSNHMMGNPDGWIQRPGGKPEVRFKMPTGGPVAAGMSYYRPYDSVEDPKKVAAPRGYPPVRIPVLKDFVHDDYKNMDLHFKRFREFCDDLGIEGWLSECGCHNKVAGRNQYAKDIIALCKKYGFDVCWWAFQDEYGANPAFGTTTERDMDYWKIIKGAA